MWEGWRNLEVSYGKPQAVLFYTRNDKMRVGQEEGRGCVRCFPNSRRRAVHVGDGDVDVTP